MYRAYDTMLQVAVSAFEAACNGDERYRYECLCCGEEVYVAAANSYYQSTHFRHRRGNNNKRCEKYLGQLGRNTGTIHHKKTCFEQADIVFNTKLRTLNLSICFDDQEINRYVQQEASLECRADYGSFPFMSLRINRLNFVAQKSVLLPIDVFSDIYYLSASSESKRVAKYLSSGLTLPIFFRATELDDGAVAKLVHSSLIYTDTEYYVLFHREKEATVFCNYSEVDSMDPLCNVETSGKTFWIAHVIIRGINSDLRNWFSIYRRYLIQSERISILWPPAVIDKGVYVVSPGQIHLSSSFQLQAHANVSLPSTCVRSAPEAPVTRITVYDRAKIYKNGVELVINTTQIKHELQLKQEKYILECYKFTIPPGGRFFLSDTEGISELREGQVVHLTVQSKILHYQSNYLVGCVIQPRKDKYSNTEIMDDIMRFYRVEHVITDHPDGFKNLSDDGQAYIDKSIAVGRINSAIKRYIEEGKI